MKRKTLRLKKKAITID